MNRSFFLLFAILLSIFAIFLELKIGTIPVTTSELFTFLQNGENLSKVKELIIELRLKRALLVLIVGAGLSISGAVYQGSLRNMLADPFLLGVSSGAALCSAIAISYNFSPLMIIYPHKFSLFIDLPIMSIFGSLLSIAFLLIIYTFRSGSLLTLILGGVAINSFLSATLTLIMYYSKNLRNIYGWLLGSFTISSMDTNILAVASLVVILSSIFLLLHGRILNLMMIDERVAVSFGVNVEKMRIKLILVSSLIVAIVVSISGMIGFIGLLVPHGARFIIGADNRYLLPFTFFAGGFILMICDLLSHILIEGIVVPIGVITSFFGAPFFIYLLLRRDIR